MFTFKHEYRQLYPYQRKRPNSSDYGRICNQYVQHASLSGSGQKNTLKTY